MKIKSLVAAMAIVLGAPAFAAIAPGTSGNGELFLVVQDSVAKVSFTLDLGITMDSFIANAEALTGYKKSFSLAADANWTAFKGAADETKAVWAILAIDSFGGTQPNTTRLVSTVRSGASGTIGSWTNQAFNNNIGATQAGLFFDAVNSTGTHAPATNYSANGSSFNLATEGFSYFGTSGGLTPNFNGGGFFSTNVVGVDSLMYYVTRSSTQNTAASRVRSDQFGNTFGATMASFDGSTVMITTPVPEPTTYALMLAGLAAVGFVARRRRA